ASLLIPDRNIQDADSLHGASWRSHGRESHRRPMRIEEYFDVQENRTGAGGDRICGSSCSRRSAGLLWRLWQWRLRIFLSELRLFDRIRLPVIRLQRLWLRQPRLWLRLRLWEPLWQLLRRQPILWRLRVPRIQQT